MKNVKKVLVLAVVLAMAFVGVASASNCTVNAVGSTPDGSVTSVLLTCGTVALGSGDKVVVTKTD